MRRLTITLGLLLLLPIALSGQSKRSSWLQGNWAGTGYQSDIENTWTMKLSARKNRYTVEYPSLKCGGRWRLVSVSRSRAVFRERIAQGLGECEPRGTFVIVRLNARQLGVWYSYLGKKEVVASAILNKQL